MFTRFCGSNAMKIVLAAGVAWTMAVPKALAKENEDVVKLDVLQMQFTTDKQSNNRTYESVFGSLTLNADLDQNRIRAFHVTSSFSTKAEFNAPFERVQGQIVPIVVKGIHVGDLDGTRLKDNGEGLLRFIPDSGLVSEDLPDHVDLQLKRVGKKQKWTALFEKKVLKVVAFKVDKNPLEMNAFSLMMSRPKIVGMKPYFLTCSSEDVAAALVVLQAPEVLKMSGCNLAKMEPVEVAVILSAIGRQLDTYSEIYLHDRKTIQADGRTLEALKMLSEAGVNLASLDKSKINMQRDYESEYDVLLTYIQRGHLESFQYLISKGFTADSAQDLEMALINVHQATRSGKIVVDDVGRKILDIVKSQNQSRGLAARAYLDLANYSINDSFSANVGTGDEHFSARAQFIKQSLQLAVSLGFDMLKKEPTFDDTLTEILKTRTSGSEDCSDECWISRKDAVAIQSMIQKK